MKVSYLITCKNETRSLNNLLERVFHGKCVDDEIIILDDFSDDENTIDILKGAREEGAIVYKHALLNDYGGHKNFGIQMCSGDFIFQIDGDELPPEALIGENLHGLLKNNPSIEAYAVPRINDFIGVTDNHAKQWGWRLTPSTSIVHEKEIDTNSSEYRFLKENGYILEETEIH